MARRFAKVSEEEIKTTFFYPSDLVNTKTTISLRVGEERWIYTSTLRVSVYIHHYSPPLRGIVVYYIVFQRLGTSDTIGLLQQTITWYKIHHAGGQAHYYSRTGTLKQRDLNQ